MLQVEHSAILSTFIKPPIVIKIFVLSIFEWLFYTGFTVDSFLPLAHNKFILQITQFNSVQFIQHYHTGKASMQFWP